MNKTITVTGVGNVKTKPDMIELVFNLSSRNFKYDQAITQAESDLKEIQQVIVKNGFEQSELKTIKFNIDSRYKSVHDVKGNYKDVFMGYELEQTLKLEFNLDMSRLAQILNQISTLSTKPKLRLNFTVRDKNAIKEELLKEAAINARHKAEILTKAAGVKLGDLVKIDYSWGEMRLYSDSRYDFDDMGTDYMLEEASFSDMTPEDISMSDTATFVWEIL